MKTFLKLCAAVVICELAGILGTLFTMDAIPTWYATLIKPVLNPPSWIFGPVWTTLYLLMGVAAFLVFQKGWHRHDIKTALKIFAAQLFFNAAWSVIFFGLHSPFWALLDIGVMWFLIIFTIAAFYKLSKPAAYLLIPYFLWVTFATYLNCSIWLLN